MKQPTPANPQPKRQHYVPRLLLRYFCPPGSDRLWVLDKRTDKVWQQTIHKVGHERYFNEAPLGNGYIVSYEHKFAYLESKCAPVLDKLNAGTPIRELSGMEFALLCYFVGVQHVRTPANLSVVREIDEAILRLFPDGKIPEHMQQQVGPLTDEAAKLFSLDTVFESAKMIADWLVPKIWVTLDACAHRSFYISDAPVMLRNHIKDEFRSTIGFAVPGIEIYMPISATTLLGAWCPMLAKVCAELDAPIRAAIETGRTLPCDSANMDFYNSLQVAGAERFVYCRDNDFDLAQSVLQQRPECRKPKRVDSNVPPTRHVQLRGRGESSPGMNTRGT